jgi:hypothetical protein
VQEVLDPTGIPTTNWTSSGSDGKAIYALVARALPSGLQIDDRTHLLPARREADAIAACDRLGIPIYVSPGDIISATGSSKVAQIFVQDIYSYTKNPRPPPEPVVIPAPVAVPEPVVIPEPIVLAAEVPPAEEVNIPAPPPEPAEPPPEPVRSPPREPAATPPYPVELPPLYPIELIPPEPTEELLPDPDLPPPASKYSLGIDLGASKLRYSLFSTDNPRSAFGAQVNDARASVDRSGALFVSPDGSAPSPNLHLFHLCSVYWVGSSLIHRRQLRSLPILFQLSRIRHHITAQ